MEILALYQLSYRLVLPSQVGLEPTTSRSRIEVTITYAIDPLSNASTGE